MDEGLALDVGVDFLNCQNEAKFHGDEGFVDCIEVLAGGGGDFESFFFAGLAPLLNEVEPHHDLFQAAFETAGGAGDGLERRDVVLENAGRGDGGVQGGIGHQ